MHAPVSGDDQLRPGQTRTSPTIETVVPIVREDLHVTKREVDTDRVRVRTVVDTREEIVTDTLQYDTLHVERRSVDRQVDAPPPPREEGDTTIVSLVEERLIVSRALFVVEEVVIRRTTDRERIEVPVALRTTRAVVDQQSTHQQEEI